ncbi:LOW QUALITY PROTEIN: hypothetical protein HID58_037705 [Brassica napus]|uniref:Uncharacterized protein n=1 Tax=Brassica napus TaxID=3708 RepID=A0ABQ8BM49_BRANA|nr:LOW QUALITY PROTEIN: hypothetical protein HID58_037705 [Brassica napus]
MKPIPHDSQQQYNITADFKFTLPITYNNSNTITRHQPYHHQFEKTIRPPMTEQENNTCTIRFRNYNYRNNLCSLTYSHNFHFYFINEWVCRNISYPVCRKTHL